MSGFIRYNCSIIGEFRQAVIQEDKAHMINNDTIIKKEKKRINWLYSAAINTAVLALILALTEIVYETNDDFAISQMIYDGYPYVRFVNYFMSRVIIFFQGFFPGVNMFMLVQMAAGFIAFTVLVKIFLDRRDNNIELILAVMLVAYFSLDHYSSIQFTKTAAILMTAGLIWAADNYTHERSVPVYIAAFIMYYSGVAFRARGMFPAIGYAGIYILIWWIFNHEEVFAKDRRKKEFGLIALILIILVVPYGIDMVSDNINAGTPELKYSREYQNERVWITDYPLMDFEESKEKYDAIGINENDIFLIDRWVFDYEGGAALENIKAINEINRPHVSESMSLVKAVKRTLRDAFYSIVNRTFSGAHIVIALALAVYILCANRPRTRWYILMFGAMTVAVYISIYYMQRPQYRALYLGEFSAVFWMMYASVTGEKTVRPAGLKAGAAILAAAILLMIWPAKEMLDYRVSYNEGATESQAVLDYYDEHPDQFFVVTTTTMGMPASYRHPLSIPSAPVNASDTGGWDTLTPYKLGCLAKAGVYNPVRELIDDPHMVFVGDYLVEELTEYYNKWCCGENETIDFVKIGEVDGLNLYNVVKVEKQQ